MQQSNDRSLGDVIKEFVKTYRLEEKIDERKLINAWEVTVGDMIARHTQNLYIRHKILFVKLDSPALKNELSYAREKITNSLNQSVGKQVVETVKFI